ncbi:hypothetical protein F5880DRAFT_1590104 [Lentinula raphanica]|nr:hypothetical protein F5880DRAFT_1590104 [Lentinula raphanica]
MSPTTTTHGHAFVPSSTFTAHSTSSYTNYHTHPTITSIWTIIALTIVVTVVSGVLCYSIYSCYQTAAYQHRLHITELNCQRAQARISVKARLSSTKDGHANEEYIEDRLLDFDIAKVGMFISRFKDSVHDHVSSVALVFQYGLQQFHDQLPVFSNNGYRLAASRCNILHT